MELIADLPVVGGFLSALFSFLIVLGVVVFVHEYGHYIVGRWCGIHADTFSMGFGPVIRSWYDKRGTKWQVSALPLGGYVRFLGDADGASRADPEALEGMSEAEKAMTFHGAPVWKRSLTVAAGPVANFILSILVFAGIGLWNGVPTSEPRVGELREIPGEGTAELRTGDLILAVNGEGIERFEEIYGIVDEMETPEPITLSVERGGDRLDVSVAYPLPPLVSSVTPLSAAASAGLEPGDYIGVVDGQEILSFNMLRDVVSGSGGRTLAMTVTRDGQNIGLEITPREVEQVKPDGAVETRTMIGVSADVLIYPLYETPGPLAALIRGMERTWEVVTMSLTGIKHIILGNLGADNLQGPLGIAQISGASASQDSANLITLIAVISTAVGLLNLFPIPVLDGGHLVMHAYEALSGRPPAESVLKVAMTLGLAAVLLLMMFATYNDVLRLVVS